MSSFRYDYEYLIHLLYCFVHGVKPEEKPENISFKNVFELGKLHEVANIAFMSIEELEVKPDEKLYNEWKIYYYFSVERDSRQAAARQHIINTLHANGIRTLEAQGTVTKKYYPESELRMMSDIDIIVDYDNFKPAESLLEGIGYKVEEQQEYEILAINDDKLLVELHADFFTEYMYNREERYSRAINKPFEHASPSVEDALTFELEDTYFYLYSILHTIKHFETAGCGIRRILDLYYLSRAFDGRVDSELINKVIDKNDFRKSYDTLFAVEQLWFENRESSLDLTEAVADIVTSGNHGTSEIFTRNNIRKDHSEGVRFAKLKRIIRFIFPDKEYIYLTYPEIRDRGYSSFRCWLYRFRGFIKRVDISHTINYIKTVIKSK